MYKNNFKNFKKVEVSLLQNPLYQCKVSDRQSNQNKKVGEYFA